MEWLAGLFFDFGLMLKPRCWIAYFREEENHCAIVSKWTECRGRGLDLGQGVRHLRASTADRGDSNVRRRVIFETNVPMGARSPRRGLVRDNTRDTGGRRAREKKEDANVCGPQDRWQAVQSAVR